MRKHSEVFQKLYDQNLSLQERLYRVMMSIMMCALLFAIIIGVISGEDMENIRMLLVSFCAMTALTSWSLRRQKIQTGAVVTSVVMLYLVLPGSFFSSGGIYGGAPLWFLFGIVYVCLIVEKQIRLVLIIGALLVDFGCYYIAFYHSEYVIPHTTRQMYSDSYVTMVLVSTLISVMFLFQNSIFRAENEVVKKQKKEIEELNRMQNRFFSSMSHEIRTPINTVIGLNEMILREDVSDEVAENARNIQSASEMLLALINDILDMSKIESGKMDIVPAEYDVGEMLSTLVGMIWVRAKEKGLEFHVDVDRTMPAKLYGDEVRVKQVLINILNNAVKYTNEGSVTLAIQCARCEDGVADVVFTVTDTGMGIKKENIPHLFRAFRRVDEDKNRHIEGTGLGLSIVKQLTELMGGEVAVNSVYTKGSTFVVTLPQRLVNDQELGELNLETRHAMNDRKHYRQSFEAPKAHVLIVDDNETNLMVAEKLLRATKVQVDTAVSGEQCLKLTYEKHYDTIFMDHLMPKMDGVECLHALRSQSGGLNHDVPVVVLTANAGGEMINLYRREGFDGYLFKPTTGIQLETELLRHLPRELITDLHGEATPGVVESGVVVHHKKVQTLITTDSVCDLPEQLLREKGIAVLPYWVNMESGVFSDGVETSSDGVLEYLREGNLVRSESPSVKDYERFFSEQLTRAHDVIHITMARYASKGYEHALEAAQMFDNVTVVDSCHLSSGMGLLVLRAADYAAGGMTPEQISRHLTRDAVRTHTSFVVDSTEYLARVGRMSARINTACRVLMLHPMLVMKGSRIRIGNVMVGTHERVWKLYIHYVLRQKKNIDRQRLFITYAGLSETELREIEAQVRQEVKFKEVIFQKASAAILTNCGPGSFGLLYMQLP